MFLSEDVNIINKRLSDTFGETLEGKPKYRIVHADDQLEKRFGDYTDWDDNRILIRRVKEVREVLKYPNSLGFYILEKWVPVPFDNGEIKEHNQYEQLWVFRNNDYTAQPLYWRAINFLVKMNLHGAGQSLSEIWEEREKIEVKEFDYFMAYLSSEAPAFDGALNAGEAVSVQGSRDEKK